MSTAFLGVAMYGRKIGFGATSNLAKFVSTKMDSVFTVPGLCFDLCFLLEYSRNIKSYTTFHEEFEYVLHGRTCYYTPEFKVVTRSNTSQFLAVKKSQKTASNKFREEFPVIQKIFQENGNELILLTEKTVWNNPLLNNLKLVHRYTGATRKSALHANILDVIKDEEICSVADLIKLTGASEGDAVAAVLSFISSGYLDANLECMDFSLQSKIWRHP